MREFHKRTWAEVSLKALRHNYRMLRGCIPDGCKCLGVVKADAYGHGALQVAAVLQSEGADYLAVACLDEALELRAGGIDTPILILGHTPYEYAAMLIENDITQTVTCLAKAEEYSEQMQRIGGSLKIHIKVDSGMSRLGFLCSGSHYEEGVRNIAQAVSLPGLDAEGIFTHFAVSDEDGEENAEYTAKQFELFTSVIADVEKSVGMKFRIRHCANSGAVLNYPEYALDMVRPGLLLYGYGDSENKLGLRPCMRLASIVNTIKIYDKDTSISYGRHFITEDTMRVGVLGIGYADGLPRSISNKVCFSSEVGPVRQLGNICMDMCMIDLDNKPEVTVGSEIEIWGENSDLNVLSQLAGTIPYELLCSVSKRVPRVYVNNFLHVSGK